jgi:glycosyltransferase involved in cell wall biosynthesis
MKKICMIAYTNYLSDARPRREAETLVRRGDQVDFIALGEKDRPAIETVEGVRLFRVKQIKYRGASGASYLLSYLRFLCAVTARLAGLYRKERYDVVYVHTMPDLLVLAALIPKLFGARVVLNLHDMMPELYMSKFGISEKHPLIRFLAFQEQVSIRLADRAIAVHDPHRDVLCRRGTPKGKITVLPNVPDPRIFRKNVPAASAAGTFRIVYHGTIARRLGLDLAVSAFAKAAPSCPSARLEIFGDGDAGDELEAQIQASGVAEKIAFSRKMFRVEDISAMIQGASVGIICNRRDLATEYMLPVKLLEYVQLGIPAIAPRLMTIEYYFDGNQVEYYEAGDVDALAAAICALYADAEKRAELTRQGNEFARHFNWEIFKHGLYRVVDGDTAAVREELPAEVAQGSAIE